LEQLHPSPQELQVVEESVALILRCTQIILPQDRIAAVLSFA